jgi:glycerophosphoryl diester phosphodiesterase
MGFNRVLRTVTMVGVAVLMLASGAVAGEYYPYDPLNVQIGPRPYFLVEDMDEGWLKMTLQQCTEGPFHKTDFSIGHRGAPLMFPEHTKESYVAAARMGAGILECDVTFTKDRELVCRHSQCDLHTTTNILMTELAGKCSEPFTPAEFDPTTGEMIRPASAKCCTSDISLEEFKTLKGKMDAYNPKAQTVEEYLDGTANYRTDLYVSRGTLMSHAESIELFKELGVKMTPELKSPSVEMPFEGDYTQQDYALQMMNEYKIAGVRPYNVFAQSFNLDDVLYWIKKTPAFGRQAVYLDGRYDDPDFDHTNPDTWSPSMEKLSDLGVNIIAPPIWMLLQLNEDDSIEPANERIEPSVYAKMAKAAGLDIITWTLERSGFLNQGGGWYYQTISEVINNDGDMLKVLDVLAYEVRIRGIFSDWPATVTYYANCMGLK